MGKRKIVWSPTAKDKLFSILEYYTLRNKSKTYSIKLYKRLVKEINLLLKHPELGIKTEDESVRGLIVGTFIIFYESTKDMIIIHALWDSRQNPTNKLIK